MQICLTSEGANEKIARTPSSTEDELMNVRFASFSSCNVRTSRFFKYRVTFEPTAKCTAIKQSNKTFAIKNITILHGRLSDKTFLPALVSVLLAPSYIDNTVEDLRFFNLKRVNRRITNHLFCKQL